MASLYAVWVPTVILAHLLGILLLLYSLEQVGGHVSKLWRKVFPKKTVPQETNVDPQEDERKLAEMDSKVINVSASPAVKVDIKAHGIERPYPANLSWSGISYQVLDTSIMEQKTVLSGCVGTACAGETVALMGPSGAGKTTLLDALAGRRTLTELEGRVQLNGRPVGKTFKRLSQYVPQEDAFVATQTTLETVAFRAALTIPSTTSPKERKQRIHSVIEILGLVKVKDTKVGGLLPGGIVVRGLSGGEKRRLSIACALVANPSILFLDEPTTGLDSFAALSVMDHMSQLASIGHTIIASVHQPRAFIFNRFNKIVLLSEGRQLYFGPPSQCVSWFEDCLQYHYNDSTDGAVSDWVMDTISVGFNKPSAMAHRSMTTMQDVINAAELFAASSMAKQAAQTHVPNPKDSAPPSPSRSPLPSPGKASPKQPRSPVPKLPLGLDVENPAGEVSSTDKAGEGAFSDVVSEISPRLKASTQRETQHWASGNYAASWLRQYRLLLQRAFLSQLRNPTDGSTRLLMSTWVGTLAGLVFDSLPEGAASTQQRLALLFFMLLLFQLMPFCFMSFFVADRRFYQADVAAGLYAPSAYYLAAVTASTPSVIINTTCGGLMAYGLTGLRYRAASIIMYVVVLALQALISHQLQIFCVWLTPNQDMAYTLATGYVAASILLSGFYLRISAIKIGFIRALSWASYTKYAMQAMGRIELLGRVWSPSTCALDNASSDPMSGATKESCVTNGQAMLNYYGYTINTAILVAALISAYIILHIGSYLALSRLHKPR